MESINNNRKLKQQSNMSKQDINKYSIKDKLRSANLINREEQVCLSKPIDNQHLKIFIPEQQNYFLHTIDKQIKYEGRILKKIKSKIQNFKKHQNSKLKIKNAFNYSHQCFTPNSQKSYRSKFNTQNATAFSTPFQQLQNSTINSNLNTFRGTNKIKTASFSLDSPKKRQKDENVPCFVRTIQSKTSDNLFPSNICSQIMQNSLIQKYNKTKKKGGKSISKKPIDEFTITGNRPIWSNFQSFRNINASEAKSYI